MQQQTSHSLPCSPTYLQRYLPTKQGKQVKKLRGYHRDIPPTGYVCLCLCLLPAHALLLP